MILSSVSIRHRLGIAPSSSSVSLLHFGSSIPRPFEPVARPNAHGTLAVGFLSEPGGRGHRVTSVFGKEGHGIHRLRSDDSSVSLSNHASSLVRCTETAAHFPLISDHVAITGHGHPKSARISGPLGADEAGSHPEPVDTAQRRGVARGVLLVFFMVCCRWPGVADLDRSAKSPRRNRGPRHLAERFVRFSRSIRAVRSFRA